MQNLETLTRLVCNIAREAGSYIRKERASFRLDAVERKHAHDYVSYVDKGSERLIVSALRNLLPEAGFITEEGTAAPAPEHSPSASSSPLTSELLWVIDPLDGTTNFIHGFAPYAVSIALLQGRNVLLGVVYEICADECFYAWQGGGAFVQATDGHGALRAEPLHVSRQTIGDALLSLQYPYNSEAYSPVIQHLISHFYGYVASIRSMGSAAMSLCYVAAGRLDGYAEKYLGRWDFMAGALIVSEAGGRVTSFEGADDFTTADGVLATNGIIHAELLKAVQHSLAQA